MQIFLHQRTKQWYQHRKKYINASEIASITGLDPFRSMEQLVHDKLFGTTFTANQYTLHGQKMEPIARQFFITKTKLSFLDTIFVDDQVKLFSASLDGYNQKNQIVLEIKCPFVNENQTTSKTWETFLSQPHSNNIPRYYCPSSMSTILCTSKIRLFFSLFR
ncbi:hypothetical Protein psc5_00130 [Candidatus Phytoplasma solani]